MRLPELRIGELVAKVPIVRRMGVGVSLSNPQQLQMKAQSV